jgi:hypothetical protein
MMKRQEEGRVLKETTGKVLGTFKTVLFSHGCSISRNNRKIIIDKGSVIIDSSRVHQTKKPTPTNTSILAFMREKS